MGIRTDEFGRLFRALSENGLLISEKEILEGTRRPFHETTSPVNEIFIPTRNRPETAARCLLSHLAASSREVSVNVVDDSDSDAMPVFLKELRTLTDEERRRVRFASRQSRFDFFEQLVRSIGPAKEALSSLRTCLGVGNALPHRYGISRNWVLLSSAGKRIVSADDDTLSEVAAERESTESVSISSGQDDTELLPMRNPSEIAVVHGFRPECVVREHAAILTGLSAFLEKRENSALMLADADVELVRRLLVGPTSIRASAFGIAGDPGRAGFQFLLFAEGERRGKFFKDRTTLDQALLAPAVVRRVPRYTIGNSSYFMSTHIGLDNRRLLPPFFPLGRNSDSIFAQMLMTLVPDALIGHLPAAIRHERPDTRAVDMKWVTQVAPSFSTFIGLLFQEYRPLPQPESADAATRRAGAFFVSIGELSLTDLADFIRLHWNRFLAEQADHLYYLLAKYEERPRFWAKHAKALISNIEGQLSSPGFPVPLELSHLRDFDSVIVELQGLIRDFGIFLCHWPELWETARQMNDAGIAFATPLS